MSAVWSDLAEVWAAAWGGHADPAREALVAELRPRRGNRVLDVGCGSGELLGLLAGRGVRVAGVDPAPRMVELARRLVPAADVRIAGAADLPWPDDTFDAVTAVNAIRFADDPVAALRECARVVRPGGGVGLSSWSEAARNDLDTLEAAVAAWHEEEPGADPAYRLRGGLEAWLAEAGLTVTSAGTVSLTWAPADEEALVRGVLFGEDEETVTDLGPVVVAAAAAFRVGAGYRLRNEFRYAVGRV